MWLWTGVAYHALSFSVINKAAYIFAALFIVGGCYLDDQFHEICIMEPMG